MLDILGEESIYRHECMAILVKVVLLYAPTLYITEHIITKNCKTGLTGSHKI